MDQDNITKIVVQLRGLAQSEDMSRAGIMVGSGEDEAVLVGTQSGYMRLIAEILEAIVRCSSGTEHQIQLKRGGSISSTALLNHFDPASHVSVSSLCLAKDEDELQEVIEMFLSLEV